MSAAAHGIAQIFLLLTMVVFALPEFAAMSLAEDDVAPLVAFLRSLNEDFAR